MPPKIRASWTCWGGGGEAGEGAVDSRQPGGGDGEAGVVPVLGRQHRCGGRADAGVGGGVFLERRGGQQRRPGGVSDGGRVAVGVGAGDRGDRPPAVVGVLGVPDGNGGVGQGDVGEREHAGGALESVVALAGERVGDAWYPSP